MSTANVADLADLEERVTRAIRERLGLLDLRGPKALKVTWGNADLRGKEESMENGEILARLDPKAPLEPREFPDVVEN
jgi:hypothetical protein